MDNENKESKEEPMKHCGIWAVFVVALLMWTGIYTFFTAVDQVVLDNLFGFRYSFVTDLGYDLMDYYRDHDQQLPPVETWADTLIEEDYKRGWQFYFSPDDNDDIKPFNIKINQFAYDVDRLPEDMVLIFDCDKNMGWNKTGGPEDIEGEEQIRVFFADGSYDVICDYEFPYLRWRADQPVPAKPGIRWPLVIGYGVLLAIISAGLIFRYWIGIKRFRSLAIGIAILSALAGLLLGGMAEGFYDRWSDDLIVSPYISGIIGLLAGLIYVGMLGNIFDRYHGHVRMLGYCLGIGCLTGLAASCVIHQYLMIFHRENDYVYMLFGSGFGTYAGIFLGLIACGFVQLYRKEFVKNSAVDKEV